jgi:cyclophilin family peptidyl-prolyl cis-trans isomerase
MVASAQVDTTQQGWRTRLPKPTLLSFPPAQAWRARMTTNKGELVLKLLTASAPMHVTSFAYLARLGFFDGLAFHRVITGFMAQGGCPLGTGTGGPGYRFDGEFAAGVKHDRPGLLSMANAGPGTDGSQFFLTFVPTPWLDGKHTLFGEVEGGSEVLRALEACGSATGRPSERLVIEKVTIEVA